jgi:hypothetical protein
MKKYFLLVVMTIFTLTASAQLITSTRAIKGERAHNFWVDLGAGGFTGDVEDTGLGVDLGIRVTKMWNNVGWDIFRLSATSDTKNFKDCLDVKLKTGVRYISPAVAGNIKIYGNADLGYGFFPEEPDNNGVTWEVGAGIMLTNRISVGLVYDCQYYKGEEYINEGRYGRMEDKNFNYGFIGLRFGFAL